MTLAPGKATVPPAAPGMTATTLIGRVENRGHYPLVAIRLALSDQLYAETGQ
jgi:hypothetical protein